MFDIYLWIKEQKSGEIHVEQYRCEQIYVTGDAVLLLQKDGTKTFERKEINMIDFSSRGIKK